jgi:two-component system, OmpR family, response regulator VicR
MQELPPLTTGEIAKFCGVNFRTVIRWIDRGILKSYKLPGRGDNRVMVHDFVGFLKQNNMPLPDQFSNLSRRVLIVDDEPSMAKSIQRVLRDKDYETEIASDGFIAGSKLESFSPTVMTLDLMMPGMSGLEVVRYIKKESRFSHVHILIISALQQHLIDQALDAGADDFLNKPFSNSDLITKVNNLSGIL